MQASSSFMVFRPPFSGQHLRLMSGHQHSRIVAATSSRDADDWKFSGRIVDENMFVLRKRIHEMKMVERNYEAPSGWMDWEKRYYVAYASHVYEGVGLLQRLLISARPSVGVGMSVLVGLSLPTSASLVLFNLIEACKWILKLLHH